MTHWKLVKKTIPKGTFLDDFSMGFRTKYLYKEDTEVEVLMKGKEIWMSNADMEKKTNKVFIEKAHGDVLIAGLGMGWVVQEIMDNPEVKTITIIEIDQGLIDFITYKKEFNDKVGIVNMDIWTFLDACRQDKRTFDVIWLDIWKDICPDNLVEMYPMKYLAENILNENGEVLVWTIEASENMTHLAFGGGTIQKERCIVSELNKRGIEK